MSFRQCRLTSPQLLELFGLSCGHRAVDVPSCQQGVPVGVPFLGLCPSPLHPARFPPKSYVCPLTVSIFRLHCAGMLCVCALVSATKIHGTPQRFGCKHHYSGAFLPVPGSEAHNRKNRLQLRAVHLRSCFSVCVTRTSRACSA